MENELKKINFRIGERYNSPFLNKVNVFQDGTVPFCRDKDGKLWAISGHSHMGEIAMFCGNDICDMQKVYPISLNFCVGNADYAFSGIRYPEGVRARGSIWPFGLYICPVTDRFFCFFHNETGWNGKGTAYDALGLCGAVPRYDSDFRHVGLMHSDDKGATWTFDRWVLTAENVCFTDRYNPENNLVKGQSGNVISLGSGDFSCFIDEKSDYIYLIYNIIKVDIEQGKWKACDAYIARTRKRTDGVMGDFVKYYNGSFCEAGNLGKETAIFKNAWHARIAYFEDITKYVVSSSPINFDVKNKGYVADYMELRTSENLTEFSAPIEVIKDGNRFGNHYQAIISYKGNKNPYVVNGDKFTVLTCHNGTDVAAYDVEIGF